MTSTLLIEILVDPLSDANVSPSRTCFPWNSTSNAEPLYSFIIDFMVE